MKIKFPYWGPFVLEGQVEPELANILLEKGNESREKNLDYRSRLAGMIDYEYYYEDYKEWFIPHFTPYINLYIEALITNWIPTFPLPHRSIIEWWSDSLWINYQKANEYNPPHNHSGDLSFVIYLQVPDEIKKENKKMKKIHRNDGPGMIHFEYGQHIDFSIGAFSKLPEVGDIFIFPAWLTHYVFPFKSDVERISVSGNIEFKYDKVASTWGEC